MKREPWEVVYEEDIYVGYRYYETFKYSGFLLNLDMESPYTSFEYENLKLNKDTFTDQLEITVDIKNTGKVAGKEVVQIYVSAPTDKLEKADITISGIW